VAQQRANAGSKKAYILIQKGKMFLVVFEQRKGTRVGGGDIRNEKKGIEIHKEESNV